MTSSESQAAAEASAARVSNRVSPLRGLAAEGSGRIVGVDLARAVAMFAMIIVHFVVPGESDSPLDIVARAANGRAMPLFMLLGGIGVCLAFRRSATPDRDLLIRAVILFCLGLILHEVTEGIAIVLQTYGLFFALAPIFRRLPTLPLALGVVGFVAIGAATYQTIGRPPRTSPVESFAGVEGIRSLVFDGYYPLFPVAAFFLLGLLIGRADLRSAGFARLLLVGGLVIGVGSVVLTDAIVGWFDLDLEPVVDTVRLDRLFDNSGHSSMPAWVISAAGTSVAALGACLLVGDRLGPARAPAVAVGSTALTFYAVQGLATNLVPDRSTVSLAEGFVTVAVLYFSYTLAAVWWKRHFRSGPLESLLRIGKGARRARSG